jgi:hypothetical protein
MDHKESNFYLSGMNVDDLIYDLSFGIRLPNPIFCPSPIAHLISKCFYDEPSKRPNFEQIKVTLKESFNKMMNESNRNAEMCTNKIEPDIHYTEINKLKDDKMKSRYKIIKRENRQEKMKHLCTKVHVVIEKEADVSLLNYACVEIASSSVNLNPKNIDDFNKNCDENIRSNNGEIEKRITNDMKSNTFVRQYNKLTRTRSLSLYCNSTQFKPRKLSKSVSATIIM